MPIEEWVQLSARDVDGLFWNGLSWTLEGVQVPDNAAGRFESDSGVLPHCSAHSKLKANFSETGCAFESCKFGDLSRLAKLKRASERESARNLVTKHRRQF